MAPPRFPNQMTLYTIGYAALKYPDRAPPYHVPSGNQVGALQREPVGSQYHQTTQIASQYLSALLDYQVSDEPTLKDPSLPQYYFSTALCLLNYTTLNPDVCKRIVARPAIMHDIIEKLLTPDFVSRMKEVPRPSEPMFPAATFDADFGSLLQFLSTILIQTPDSQQLHPRISELIPKLRTWKQTYRHSSVKTISNASERLVGQIAGMDPDTIDMMRSIQDNSLKCGVVSCNVSGASNLTACGSCRIQRYCGRDHQRADWKYHKHICNKGLQEPVEDE